MNLVQVIRTVHHAFRITFIALRNALKNALIEPTKFKIIPNVKIAWFSVKRAIIISNAYLVPSLTILNIIQSSYVIHVNQYIGNKIYK